MKFIIRGKDNFDADYLSRIGHIPNNDREQQQKTVFTTTEVIKPVDLQQILSHQKQNIHIANAIDQLEASGEITKGIYRDYKNLTVRNGTLYKGETCCNPLKSLIDRVVEVHGQYHAGVENTLLMIKSRFYWRGIEKDVRRTVANCRTCAQCKPRSKPKAELQPPTRDFSPLERVCIDVGTMPLSLSGNKKFLLMVDEASKFVVTAVMEDEIANSIRKAIWSKWIPYFGIPTDLHSDQGHNVDGKVIRELCK